MKQSITATVTILASTLLAGCASQNTIDSATWQIDGSRLSPADTTLSIPGLGPCTDNPDRSLRLDSKQPVTVFVHGCFDSSGRFRSLAQVFAFHGQQTACFTYDDRASMMLSSRQLATALDKLAESMENKAVTVIGHSQGALIARKALVSARPDTTIDRELQLRLVTVSGPFAGIASANSCVNPLMRALTLGLVGPMCRIITGEKWSEITHTSEFIRQPGTLHPQVRDFLQIATDERGACRRSVNGECIETDDVFSLDEQRNPIIDVQPITRTMEVKAGHVEIVGDRQVAPDKLIAILQQEGIMNPTEVSRQKQLGSLLARLYDLLD